MKEEIKKYYQYLYNHIYNTNVYMSYTPNQNKMIDNFLLDMEKKCTIDKELLFNFLSYQVQLRLQQKTQRRIQLNWIIGKTAIKYWDKKPQEYTWILRRFWKKYSIVLPNVNKSLKDTYKDLYKEYSLKERNRFDDDYRLLYCIKMCLFEEDSFCKECKFYKFCKNK